MSTKNLLKLASGGAMAVILLGCGGFSYPVAVSGVPQGSIYSGVQAPNPMDRVEITGPGKTGDKHGEACATGILGAVAFGDASLDAAKKAGGISEVHSVEVHHTNILGIYVQGCTEVHGK
jgi:hypothetical protein